MGEPELARVRGRNGAASLRADDVDVGTLLGRADRNLYEAKRAGRNRVAPTARVGRPDVPPTDLAMTPLPNQSDVATVRTGPPAPGKLA